MMTVEKKSAVEKPERILEFKKIIWGMKRKEEASLAQGSESSGHFIHVNPDDLGETDYDAYMALKTGKWLEDPDLVGQYRTSVNAFGNESQRHFLSEYLANKYSVQSLRKEMRDLEIKESATDAMREAVIKKLFELIDVKLTEDQLKKFNNKDFKLLESALKNDDNFPMAAQAYRGIHAGNQIKLQFIDLLEKQWRLFTPDDSEAIEL